MSTADHGPGWPFWAPSPEHALETACDLAGLRPGDRFLDAGCGDGRALLAAARRGAAVCGIEISSTLAAHAETRLREHGLTGAVLVADFLEEMPNADVVFAYLSPAMLQRLWPVAERCMRPGGRIVTYGFAIPGIVATQERLEAHCRLYRSPMRREPPRHPGWEFVATETVMPPGREALIPLQVTHPGGPVVVRVTGPLSEQCSVRTGSDRAEPGDVVAIDVRWAVGHGPSAVEGALVVNGLPAHPIRARAKAGGARVSHFRDWESFAAKTVATA